MEPNRVGRVLGIGTRIAAGKIRDGAARAAAAAAQAGSGQSELGQGQAGNRGGAAGMPGTVAATAPISAESASAVVADGGRRLARGAGRFGAAMFRPVAHAGGILWLQISGVFFATFALFFLSHAWQTIRAAGWRDRHAEIYTVLAAAFCWFTVSSFWRARKKQQRG